MQDRIRNFRKERGLNQTEFGLLAGVDQATVSRWEKGIEPRGPARKLLESILSAHEVSPATVDAGQSNA